MTWEPYIQCALDSLREHSCDEYFSVFNAIIATVFMRDATPEFIKSIDEFPERRKGVDWVFMLGAVCRKSYNCQQIASPYYGDPFYPVFFFLVMPPGDIDIEGKRSEALYLVEMQLKKFASSCPNPIIYGISAMGTRCSIFSLKVGDPYTSMQLLDSGEESSNVTDSQWPFDLRSPAGEAKVCQLMDRVKGMTSSWGLPPPPFRRVPISDQYPDICYWLPML